MPSCVYKKCTNSAKTKNKSHGISFHSFPQDEVWRHKWLQVVRKQRQEPDWLPHSSSRLCSVHFRTEDMYTTQKGYRKILKNAVPKFQVAMSTYSVSGRTTPNSLNDVNISDLESVFETPRKAFLKLKLNKETIKKRKLMQDNKNLKKKCKRLNHKCKSLKETIIQLKKRLNLTVDQFAELTLKAEAVDLFQRMVRYKKLDKNSRMKFPPSLRKFALTLNFYSPTGYKYVREVFENGLPHPRTLGKWYEKTDAAPGFTAEAFAVLKKKYAAMKTKMICTLVVDEMSIRQQLMWDGKKTDGLVDYGTGSLENAGVATQAFVMMLVSMNENWKLPVAYFFVNGLPAESKANLIKTCLEKCHEVGVSVVALTFDGCRSNMSSAKLLGCELDDVNNLKTTFKHPSCDMDVAVFPDPCHMIKLVRNTFEAKKIFYDGEAQEIKWQFLVNLLELQKSETLTFANKLTLRHIEFRNQIMKVKLATQLLSMSVAKSLKLCEEILNSTRFRNTDATVKFIENFNHIFDIMNSRKRDKFGYRKPICPENKNLIFDFLTEMKDYIISLRYLVKSRRITKRKINIKISKKPVTDTICKTGFIGFIICMESLKHLYTTLVETNILKYIATCRMSQDHLELFFGVIRRQGGYNNNPNVKQFRGIYRKILGHLELRSSLSGNCIPLDNFPILTCTSAVDVINETVDRKSNVTSDTSLTLGGKKETFKKHQASRVSSRVRVQNIKKNKVLLSDTLAETNVGILNELLTDKIKHNLSTCTEQIVGYIAGWVARALIKTIKCETCVSQIITAKKMHFHKLITLKDMGGLCYPSYDLFMICAKSEITLKKIIAQGKHFTSDTEFSRLKLNIMKTFLGTNILTELVIHSQNQPATFNHRTHLLRAIIDKYCDVRLHYSHKNDPSISAETKRQKRNKLSLLEGK